MSFVAKVFVVFNLLLSALFFYFAMYEWTAQVKWQKMYEAEKARKVTDVASVQEYIIKLSTEVVKAQQREVAAKADLSKEKLARDQERDAALKLQSELAQEKNARELAIASKEEIEREYRRVTQELGKARAVVLKIEQALNVEKDNATRASNARAEMEVQYNQLAAQVSGLERQRKSLEQDLASANRRVEKAILSGQLLDDSPVQPSLQAQVLAVRNDVGLVMISVGSKQDVKPGFVFTITRGNKYIGKVMIDVVYPEMASAKIDPALMNKDGLAIEVHDMASSGR